MTQRAYADKHVESADGATSTTVDVPLSSGGLSVADRRPALLAGLATGGVGVDSPALELPTQLGVGPTQGLLRRFGGPAPIQRLHQPGSEGVAKMPEADAEDKLYAPIVYDSSGVVAPAPLGGPEAAPIGVESSGGAPGGAALGGGAPGGGAPGGAGAPGGVALGSTPSAVATPGSPGAASRYASWIAPARPVAPSAVGRGVAVLPTAVAAVPSTPIDPAYTPDSLATPESVESP